MKTQNPYKGSKIVEGEVFGTALPNGVETNWSSQIELEPGYWIVSYLLGNWGEGKYLNVRGWIKCYDETAKTYLSQECIGGMVSAAAAIPILLSNTHTVRLKGLFYIDDVDYSPGIYDYFRAIKIG